MILHHTLPRSRRAAAACLGVAALAMCAATTAHAGRPMTVDDAVIVAPGLCEVETYAQHADNAREYWATSACNVGGAWELAAGAGWADNDRGATRYGHLHAKTVFKPLEAGGWGVGLALTDQFRSGRGLDGDLSASVPLSFSLRGDSVLLHLNAGVVRTQATRSTDATWGIGAEFKLDARNSLTVEAYGQQRTHSRYQFGVAHQLIPDRLQIDATWGNRLVARGGSEPVVTLGLVLQTN